MFRAGRHKRQKHLDHWTLVSVTFSEIYAGQRPPFRDKPQAEQVNGDCMANRDGMSTVMISDHRDACFDRSHSQRMVALGELSSGITHDFRNVLQTLISSLEIIESRSNDPDEVRRLTASALRVSERGIGLTRRLLAFSRREAAEIRCACLLSSLESATETLSRTIGTRMNVRIESLPADLWQAVIDPTEFELAIINLGINARDAMPHGGRIQLSARNVTIPRIERRTVQPSVRLDRTDRRGPRLPLSGGDYVAVTVSDTGIGMDEATLARAVEPFFTTKAVGKGTGLGLAMAHSLATQGGGTLRLMSELGRGTTVEMWLPRASATTSPS
jgi:signal transduction histidine kinase